MLFLLEFYARLTIARDHATTPPTNFWDAARHVPINFVYFQPTAEFEENIYLHAMQIMEDFRTD